MLKKKTSIHKYEGEYQSPDGDIYDCTVIQHGERCYMQWSRQIQAENQGEGEKPAPQVITVDAAMIEGLYKWYLEITGKLTPKLSAPQKGLKKPMVIDHRDPQGIAVHNIVKTSMENYDDTIRPVESLSNAWDGGVGSAEMRYGIDPFTAAQEAPDTPAQWKLTNTDNMPRWKKEAQERQTKQRPYNKIGEIKRVGAQDIL
jgi:hypothetical protein